MSLLDFGDNDWRSYGVDWRWDWFERFANSLEAPVYTWQGSSPVGRREVRGYFREIEWRENTGCNNIRGKKRKIGFFFFFFTFFLMFFYSSSFLFFSSVSSLIFTFLFLLFSLVFFSCFFSSSFFSLSLFISHSFFSFFFFLLYYFFLSSFLFFFF